MDAREASFARLRVLRRSRFIEQLGRSAFGDRALGLFRMYEEPHSIVQSRTIERRVLGTICGRRHVQRKTRGDQSGHAVEWHARRVHTGAAGAPPSTARDAARSVALPWRHSGVATRRRLQKSRDTAAAGGGSTPEELRSRQGPPTVSALVCTLWKKWRRASRPAETHVSTPAPLTRA